MAKKKIRCVDCLKDLTKDEIALCKKLEGNETQDFMCLKCHSEFIGCTQDDLIVKIAEFKEQGCTLFV